MGLLDAFKQYLEDASPGGVLNPNVTPQGLLDAAALVSTPVPIGGDILGLLADAKRFKDNPEERTAGNFALSGLGLLPFIPALGVLKRADGLPLDDDVVKGLLSEDKWLDRGLKVRKNQKLYRGSTTGDAFLPNASASRSDQGRGLYVTTDKAQAKEYGDVFEMPMDALPQNPIRFQDEMAYQNWVQNVRENLGYKRMSEFVNQFPGDDAWIRELDPNIDGIQIGEGAGSYFVRFPEVDSLKNADNLPMDEASRLKRAKEMGFDTDTVYYHGTRSDFDEFSPSHPRGAPGNEKGVYFTKDYRDAEEYAEDVDGAFDSKSKVIKAFLRNPDLVNNGYLGDEYLIRNPKDIRSILAKFDPTKADSADIMAGVAGLGIAGLLGAPMLYEDRYE